MIDKADLDPQKMQIFKEIPGRINTLLEDMQAFITENLKSLKSSLLDNLQLTDLMICQSYKCINDSLTAYSFKEEEKGLYHVDKSYRFSFKGNHILFMRVLFNLISNALYQIHQNGKGEIFISSEDQDEYNIIRFRDTAGGASPDIVNQIFDGYKTTKENGTGIGLAFCKMTMQSFGGDMTCHSVEGEYIDFVMFFPKIPDTTESIVSK